MKRATPALCFSRLVSAAGILAALALSASAQGRTAQASVRQRSPRLTIPPLHCIDFEGLARGTKLSSVSTVEGLVSVKALSPAFGATNVAVVFDSAHPTGGDWDLGTPNQTFGGPGVGVDGELGMPYQNAVAKGKVLIVADNLNDSNNDGLVDLPNDADLVGEQMIFNFSSMGSVEVESIFLIDTEEEKPASVIRFYAPGGALVGTTPLPMPGDNGVVHINYNAQNVERIVIGLNGSAAIDDICFRRMVDCNGNGIQDNKDIAGGTSPDCNGNGIPDECEPDCDGNGVPDDCEPDCDGDGTPDACEPDCDGDGIPDACDGPDCNGNGLPDNCDIAGGAPDCDGNGVPDECDPDCDGDGIPDACDGPDCNGNGLPDNCDIASGAPDCDGNGVPDECDPDCDGDGIPDACDGPDCNGNGLPDNCDIANGSPDCNGNGVPDECEPDCDGDGNPDACQGPDCNNNGLPDNCDIANGAPDCNGNGYPDECELDCDGDGLPDDCDGPDCNGNGLPDNCDIAYGTSDDENGDGIPDECQCLAKIGDFVWNDIDRDGIQDPSEPGIEGVTVVLTDPLGNVLATTTTNMKGYYLFSGLCAGDYIVCVDEDTLPPNFVASPCNMGSDDALDNDCCPQVVSLPTNLSCDLTNDFGFNSPCSGLIGDFVWHDLDRDGIQEVGEPGIEGVTVTLKDCSGNVLSSVTTGPFGFYSFMGLCAGCYQVCVDESTLPPGLVASPCNAGSDDTVDNDCSCATVVLPTDFSQDVTIDFGYNQPCTGIIGDYVWDDLDQDGLQDPDEIGIEDVLVVLEDSLGNVIATVSTGPDGDYLFTELCAGDYTVCVDESTLPAGYAPTLCNVGSDDTIDNDCSCEDVTLTTDDDTDLTIDFGYVFTTAGGGEGCTPGYWKQDHHFDSWTAPYTPSTLFSDVFEDAFPGMTLLEVMETGGGGLEALGRHVVAALLNAASGGVSYDLTPAQVIQLFNDLFPATEPEHNALKDYFQNFNESGCPLN